MANYNYTIKPIETKYAGITFRSRLEATWACFFDKMDWQWEYEPLDMQGWTPDFALIGRMDTTVFVEVKPIFQFTELSETGKYVRPKIEGTSLGNCLILGACPIREPNGYFEGEEILRIGWIYNSDGNEWENVAMKGIDDISNTKQTIYNFLNNSDEWDNFSQEPAIEFVMGLWNEAKNETQFLNHKK